VARDGDRPHAVSEDAVVTAFPKKNPAHDPKPFDQIFSFHWPVLHRYV